MGIAVVVPRDLRAEAFRGLLQVGRQLLPLGCYTPFLHRDRFVKIGDHLVEQLASCCAPAQAGSQCLGLPRPKVARRVSWPTHCHGARTVERRCRFATTHQGSWGREIQDVRALGLEGLRAVWCRFYGLGFREGPKPLARNVGGIGACINPKS